MSAKKKISSGQMEFFIDQHHSAHNPYWTSSLFNEVFLRNDLPKKYAQLWENDEIGSFYDFYTGFMELVQDLKEEEFETWKETDTINNWIKRVMELLGWANNCTRNQEPFSSEVSFTVPENGVPKTYRPDLLYFDSYDHKKYVSKETVPASRLREARDKNTGVLIPLEAKYWDRLEEYKKGDAQGDKKRNNVKADDNTRSLSPDDQLLKYADILKKDFGILTDGKTWRLLHREMSQGAVKRCFEFDLGNLIHLIEEGVDVGTNFQEFLHYAKYFFLFFGKESHMQNNGRMPFVFEVLEYSKKYASKIEEDLRKRFIVAMGYTCNSIKLSIENSGEDVDLDIVRNVAESHLFNVLFFKSCEVRKILPVQEVPYFKLSLTEVVESIDFMGFDPAKDIDFYLPLFQKAFKGFGSWDDTYLHDRLMRLYKIVHKGASLKDDFGFEITGFKESVFDKEEWRFAKKHKIDNKTMALVLFALHFTESEFNERKYQQIPYSYFTPRQLGSIYESFLEFNLQVADADMAFINKKWQKKNVKAKHVKKLNLEESLIVRNGDLYFTPNNKDRKMSGSFYTPEYIVRYMVEATLKPLIEDFTSSEVLQLNICDPAMGSGHFLSSTLEYLTDEYRERLQKESEDDLNESVESSRRLILDSCIYGVDLNSRAAKLAKMSLWLITAYPKQKLERLDDQLKSGNSLVSLFNWKKEFPKVFKKKGFDYVFGNPPWGAPLDDIKEYIGDEYPDVSFKNLNSFDLFIRKSVELINPNGIVSFIVPRNIIRSEDYADLRSGIIIPNSSKLIDFGAAFEGVTQEAVALTFSQKKCDQIEIFPFARLLLNSKKEYEMDDLFKSNHVVKDESFYSKSLVSTYSNKRLEKILAKIETEEKLSSFILNTSRGIEIGGSGELGVCPHCKYEMPKPKKKKDTKKCPSCKKMIHLAEFKTVFAINEVRPQKKSPEICAGRGIGRYSYNRSGYLNIKMSSVNYKDKLFNREPSIFMCKTSGDLQCYYDNTGEKYTTQSAIVVKPTNEDSGYWVTAVLNSSVLEFFYEYAYVNGSALTTALTGDVINNFPIPPYSKSDLKKVKSRIQKLQSGKGDIIRITQELDDIIFDSFGISNNDAEAIIDFISYSKGLKKLDVDFSEEDGVNYMLAA